MNAHAFPHEHLIATTPDWPVKGVLFRDISPLLARKFPETVDALAEVLFNPADQETRHSGESRNPKTLDPDFRRGDDILNLDSIDAFAGPARAGAQNKNLSLDQIDAFAGPARAGAQNKNLSLDQIDAFAGIDARGFIFAAALAQKFSKNLVIVRKGGKLPPPAHQESYALEYGAATLELKPATPIPLSPLLQGGDVREGGGDVRGGGFRAPRIVILDDVLATGGTLTAAANLCATAGYDVVSLATLIDLKFLSGDFEWRGIKPKAVVTYE